MALARRTISAEKLFGDRLGGDVVHQILSVSHSPEQTLALLRPDVLVRVDRIAFWVDVFKLTFLSCLFLMSTLRLLFCLRGDLEIERNRSIYASRQRQRDCMDEYVAEGCDDTDFTMDGDRCGRLRICAGRLEAADEPSYFTVLWGMMNMFFYSLTPKAAGLLGVFSGCFLYANVFRK
jgi:hypothetical protein